MKQKPIFYKSDFTVILASEAQWGGCPFRLSFYTASPSRSFVASFDGENYENCRLLEDGRLEIGINQKDGTVQTLMGIGTLHVAPEFYLDNDAFRDHICNQFVKPFVPVFIDEDGTEYEAVLDLQGSSTIVTIGTLPAYYQKGLTEAEHDALIAATERAEHAGDNVDVAIAAANEATRRADEARQALAIAYNEKVAALDADYAQKKSALEADYAEVKGALSSDYASVKAQLDADYAATKEALARDYSTAAISLNARMTEIESQFSADREAWNKSVADFITASQATFDGKLTDWQSQVDAALADITRLQQKDVEQDAKLSELDDDLCSVVFLREMFRLIAENGYVPFVDDKGNIVAKIGTGGFDTAMIGSNLASIITSIAKESAEGADVDNILEAVIEIISKRLVTKDIEQEGLYITDENGNVLLAVTNTIDAASISPHFAALLNQEIVGSNVTLSDIEQLDVEFEML